MNALISVTKATGVTKFFMRVTVYHSNRELISYIRWNASVFCKSKILLCNHLLNEILKLEIN